MDEERKREAKLITLAMAKIREFCQKQEDCAKCPLGDPNRNTYCRCTDTCPQDWDPDEALYRIAYDEGRRA